MFRVDRYEESDEESISHLSGDESKKLSIAEIARAKISKKVQKRKLNNVTTSPVLEDKVVNHTDNFKIEPKKTKIETVIAVTSSVKEVESIPNSPISEIGSPENFEELQIEENDLEKDESNTGYLPVFQTFNEEEDVERRSKFKKSKLGLPSWLAAPKVIQSQSSEPITKLEGKLHPHLLKRCEKSEISELFAVQIAVLNHLALSQHPLSERFTPGDLCVSAPTGSGKTLAYVLPIIHRLIGRTVTRLRALVLVPTRDLMIQVKEVFDFFCYGTSLKVGSFAKASSFSAEQQRLVSNFHEGLCGGSSNVDILISTPGRLLDHLKETPNFSLQHLRFLVVDEADRLLSENFSDWLPLVMDALNKTPTAPLQRSTDLLHSLSYKSTSFGGFGPTGHPYLSHDAISHQDSREDSLCLFSHSAPQIQKLLFSATLTRNPGKIASLRLQNPAYISVQASTHEDVSRYCTPATLKELFVVCSAAYKPLLLLHMLSKHQIKNALVFTKSVEASTRLYHFIDIFSRSLDSKPVDNTEETEHVEVQAPQHTAYLKDVSVANFSSELSRPNRQKILKEFKAGSIRILVCSDLLARGLDIEGVSAVINYDSPHFIKQYIHRVGRTARAGNTGLAITLLAPSEVTPFKLMQDKGNRRDFLEKDHIDQSEFNALKPIYKTSLQEVEKIISQKDA